MQSMLSNRRLPDLSDLIAKYEIPTTRPPPDSLFWMMWDQVGSIACDTLTLPFLQGIRNGTLDPNKYGGYNVADAYYCFKGADAYKVAISHTEWESPLRAFLGKKYISYKKYNDTFPDTWHVSSAAAVTPPRITKEYAAYEDSVARRLPPIYALIVMLPCEYLWAWLASEMAPAKPGNVYAGWIKDNMDPSGAYAMGNFLHTYMERNRVDRRLAIEVYRKATYYEYANFAAATGDKVKDSSDYGLTDPDIPESYEQ